jgi:hypothetical protein
MVSTRAIQSRQLLWGLAVVALIAGACSSSSSTSTASSSQAAAPAGGASKPCTGQLQIGVNYLGDRAAAFSSFGLGAAASNVPSNAQTENEFRATFNYINAHGGLNGCTAVPVFHGVKYLDPDTNAEGQSQCVDFTEDHHVFAALTFFPAGGVPSQTGCLASKGVPELFPPIPGAKPAMTPDLWLAPEVGDTAIPGQGPALIDAVQKAGGLLPGAKIGYLYEKANLNPDPSVQALDLAYRPELTKFGLSVVDVEALSYTPTGADLNAVASDCQNSALKFRAAGVTEVILPTSAILTMCAKAWNSQAYAPRMLVLGAGGYLVGVGSIGIQGAALSGALGKDLWQVSTSTFDLGGGGPIGSYANWPQANKDKQQKCDAIIGNAVASAQEGPQFNICETLLWFQAAMAKAPTATPAGLLKGIDSLGAYDGFSDTWGPLKFSPGHPYGLSTVQIVKYDPAKIGFAPVGSPTSL